MTFREQFLKLVGERKLWAYALALLAITIVAHDKTEVAVDGIIWALAAFCGGNALSYFGQRKGA